MFHLKRREVTQHGFVKEQYEQGRERDTRRISTVELLVDWCSQLNASGTSKKYSYK